MVLATCLRATRRRSDAEDTTQETFLKLAQSARRIRSNAAAWLHACALRTSIDLQRRRGSQARAEQGASVEAQGLENEAGRTWHEIKPMLDEALAALHEDDRELIVQRYFVGWLENEMARDAGLKPGTKNRRVDKAVKKLRTHLARSGLALAGAGGLGAALGMGASPPVSGAVTTSLMEIGVAGPGAAAAPEQQDRPTGNLGPFMFLSSMLDGVPNGQLTTKDRRLACKNDFGPGAESAEIVLRIEHARGDGRAGTWDERSNRSPCPSPTSLRT